MKYCFVLSQTKLNYGYQLCQLYHRFKLSLELKQTSINIHMHMIGVCNRQSKWLATNSVAKVSKGYSQKVNKLYTCQKHDLLATFDETVTRNLESKQQKWHWLGLMLILSTALIVVISELHPWLMPIFNNTTYWSVSWKIQTQLLLYTKLAINCQ